MIGLLCFILAVLASPFKSKLRVCTENLNPNVLTMKSAQLAREFMTRIAEPGERQAHPCSMTDAFSRRYNSPHSFSESDADVRRPRQ
jgi:hypothetical protein